MIIANGTLAFKVKTPGGINPSTGYPTAATEAWGTPVLCQIIPLSGNNLGKKDGERFTVAAYKILIEKQPLPNSEQIRLTWNDGTPVGDFSLLSHPERLDAVNQIQLLV